MPIEVARPTAVLLIVLLGLPIAGCDGQPAGVHQPAEPVAAAEPGTGNAVTVRVVDETEFAQVLRQYRGKVVLVDFWATWCPSCLELFPHTVELSKRLADRGLVVISLSMDDPENEPNVLQALQSHGAAFDNLISRYGGSDRSAVAFGLEDLVLPKYRLYDRQGKLHKTLRSSQGPIEPEQIDRAVEELLGRS